MADAWKIEILASAARDLGLIAHELGDGAYDEVLQDILGLEENPLPPGHLHRRGTKADYRIYTYRSMYRILYRLLIGKRTVPIVRVRPRGTAYSGFDRW